MSTDIPDLIAGALGVSRGTAYDMMREVLAEQPAQQQEPDIYPDEAYEMGLERIAYYTSPPASKPWVGLTEYERADVYKSIPAKEFCVDAVGIAIEAKLREKNA